MSSWSLGHGATALDIGIVRSGLGDAAQWIRLLLPHYRKLTGVDLFPGTLNVELSRPWGVPAGARRLAAEDYGGRVSIYVVPCRILGTKAWILRTEANERGDGDHPRTIIELATELHLRSTFKLEDGDEVELLLP